MKPTKITLEELKAKKVYGLTIKYNSEDAGIYGGTEKDEFYIDAFHATYESKAYIKNEDKSSYCFDSHWYLELDKKSSELFESLGKAVLDLVTDKQIDDELYCDCDGFSFTLDLFDDTKFHKDIYVPRETFKTIIDIIKKILPKEASLPEICKPYKEPVIEEVPF